MKALSARAFTLLLLSALAGCSGQSSFSPVGPWGIDYSAMPKVSMPGSPKDLSSYPFIEFTKDNRFTLLNGYAVGTWECQGTTVTLRFENNLRLLNGMNAVLTGTKDQTKMEYVSGEKHLEWVIKNPKMNKETPLKLRRVESYRKGSRGD